MRSTSTRARTAALALGGILLSLGAAVAQEREARPDPIEASLERWRAMRFGMFIHWGPVSLKGTEIGWSRGAQVPREEYDALYESFDPQQFDAGQWARIAREAGMKYVILTAKHHDGFCLWDTQQTDYDVMASPFGRDVVGELSAACREEGLAFGTYYSILDWYQPDYNTVGSHGGPGFELPPGLEPDMDRYQAYVHSQILELSRSYGPLITFWFDGEWEEPWSPERGQRLFGFCRRLDPAALVNNRVGKGREGMAGTTAQTAANPGDYDTPEQRIGAFEDRRPWETCMTICRQWAWKPEDELKSLEQCVHTLVRTSGGDGNLLLNVGPMPDGRIEARQVQRLKELGEWLSANGESIHGTRGGPFRPGDWGASTHREDRVFVHVLAWEGDRVSLPGLDRAVLSASLLAGGGEVGFEQTEEGIALSLEAARQDPVDTVVVLGLDAPVGDAGPVDRR